MTLATNRYRPGWPTYPTIVRPKTVLQAGTPQIAGTMATLQAVRFNVIRRLDQIIELLSSPVIQERAASIQRLATQYAALLPVGRLDHERLVNMCHSGLLPRYIYRAYNAGLHPVESFAPLTYAQLEEPEILRQLANGICPAGELLEYQGATSLDQLRSSLKAEVGEVVNEVNARIGSNPLDIEAFYALFPLHQDAKSLGGEVWDLHVKLGRAQALLVHDIHHNFATELLTANCSFEISEKGLPVFLYAYKQLDKHLAHLKSVLQVCRWRLSEEANFEQLSIGALAEAAVYAAAYRLHLPVEYSSHPGEGYISYFLADDLNDMTVSQALELILYNLQKNSGKALIETPEGEREALRHKWISLRAARDGDFSDVVAIEVADNGIGFQLQELIRKVQEALGNPEWRHVYADHPVVKKIMAWQTNPFIIRTLTTGELMDLAFLNTISGFHKSFSSGLGLDEVAELCQSFNADIILTNRADGGALVKVLIGPAKSRRAIIARDLYPN